MRRDLKSGRMPLLQRMLPRSGARAPGHSASLGSHERAELIARTKLDDAAGRYAASLASIELALRSAPGDAELLFARARTLFCWRRCREARAGFLRAQAAGLRTTSLYLNLGWACFGMGELDEAEAWMRKALTSDDQTREPTFNLAVVLQARQCHTEAAECYERALERHAHNFDCHIGLGTARLGLDDAVAAEAQFREAITTDGSRKVAWVNLGAALGRQHRPAEALEAFVYAETLEEREGEETDNFVNVAIGYVEDGRIREALAVFERGLAERPGIGGYYAYALALLKAGRLREGWHYYEFRRLRDSPSLTRPESHHPVWEGQDLRGKTILLHVEQGFGDVIQLVRYAPCVKALGSTVMLRVSRPMRSLARTFAGVDRVVDPDGSIPEFDFLVHLFSLPRIFNTEVDSIPAVVPYIEAPVERVRRWSGRLGDEGALKVGVVWAGNPEHKNDRYRSIRLAALAPLWQVAGVRFIALQKGAAAGELVSLPAGLDVVNLGPELEDFCDTAAVISQLDLVLCVDTAVAHLAGALGKPVWLMVAQPADFRWLEGREDSPWYPTMRLFRQSRRGDWDEVIERVQVALQVRVREGAVTAASVQRAQAVPPLRPLSTPEALLAGHRPGLSAVAETRVGIVQYLPDEARVGESIAWYGEYLQPQLDLLARLIRPGATVLEAGAGVGMHALFLGAAVGAAGHLFVYEPRPVVQRILRQNLGANGVSNATVMRRALGRSAAQGTDAVEAVGAPLRESVDELRLERLDWLKVDDASGVEVLEGAAETLWRLRPRLFLAAADEAMLGTLVERAKAYSYRCWRLETGLFNAANFNRRDTDIFAGRKALALLAIPEEIDVDMALDECVEI
jgi:tetratricopeptide (TPR) repeat protein